MNDILGEGGNFKKFYNPFMMYIKLWVLVEFDFDFPLTNSSNKGLPFLSFSFQLSYLIPFYPGNPARA